MGVRNPSAATNTFIGPLPATAAETIVFTTPLLNLSLDNATVLLYFCIDITAGATATAHRFIIRRGTALTSPSVMVATLQTTEVAGARNTGSGVYFDLPGVAADLQYTLTIQQIAATGAGSFIDGSLLAMVL